MTPAEYRNDHAIEKLLRLLGQARRQSGKVAEIPEVFVRFSAKMPWQTKPSTP
jgi:hypothetical protein